MPTSNVRQQVAVEPVAWVFELASSRRTDGTYTDWRPPQLSFTEPCVPEGSIRNLRPLFDAASTKQAEGHSEFCSAQVGPVEDCPVCADQPALPVDVAEIEAPAIHLDPAYRKACAAVAARILETLPTDDRARLECWANAEFWAGRLSAISGGGSASTPEGDRK